MIKYLLIILLFISQISTSQAGSTIVSAPISSSFGLNPKQTWTSNCLTVIPPFAVYAATTDMANLIIRRYADKNCRYMLDTDSPIPEKVLKKDNLCFASAYCNSQGAPDSMPFTAIKVIIVNAALTSNVVIALELVQDPIVPDPPKPSWNGTSYDR